MEGEEEKEQNKSRVVKVDSKETWDSSLSQANNHHGSIIGHHTAKLAGRGTVHGIVVHAFCGDEPFLRRATSYPDVLFLTVDVDDVKDVASSLEIKAMPPFLIIKDGAPVEKLVGANPEEIKKRVNSFVQ